MTNFLSKLSNSYPGPLPQTECKLYVGNWVTYLLCSLRALTLYTVIRE